MANSPCLRTVLKTAVSAAAFGLLSPLQAHAAASLEVMQELGSGFGRISPLGLALFGIFLVAILAIFVVFEIVRTDSKQREKIDIGWQYFAEMAGQKRLTPQETDILRRIVEQGGVSSADMVFDSSFIYEDALEAFLKDNAKQLDREETQYALLRGLRMKLGYSHLPAEVPISSTRQLEEGMPVNLIDGEGISRKGRVQEVREKSWAVALEAEIPPTVAVGAAVEMSLLRPGDGEYIVRLPIAATRLGARAIFLPHTRTLERKQLRNWVRIDVNIPCRVTVMARYEGWTKETGGPGPGVGMVLEGRMLDLSGGGTCARFSSPIPQGYKLSVNFDLPGTSLRGVQSEVMRMTSVVKGNREDFEHNLKFMNMETAAQEKIVRYVFEKQRIDSQMRGPIKIE
ncbi:MAG TPA: PilZ domain-containing protein [Fibrobacteria bacterium]|nr:PilZ domain-containing protein [Fibrobacteria bacterium]